MTDTIERRIFMEQITRQEFISFYQQNITRKGADRLLSWMEKSDFFTAPASTRYHLACEGGFFCFSPFNYSAVK